MLNHEALLTAMDVVSGVQSAVREDVVIANKIFDEVKNNPNAWNIAKDIYSNSSHKSHRQFLSIHLIRMKCKVDTPENVNEVIEFLLNVASSSTVANNVRIKASSAIAVLICRASLTHWRTCIVDLGRFALNSDDIFKLFAVLQVICFLPEQMAAKTSNVRGSPLAISLLEAQPDTDVTGADILGSIIQKSLLSSERNDISDTLKTQILDQALESCANWANLVEINLASLPSVGNLLPRMLAPLLLHNNLAHSTRFVRAAISRCSAAGEHWRENGVVPLTRAVEFCQDFLMRNNSNESELIMSLIKIFSDFASNATPVRISLLYQLSRILSALITSFPWLVVCDISLTPIVTVTFPSQSSTPSPLEIPNPLVAAFHKLLAHSPHSAEPLFEMLTELKEVQRSSRFQHDVLACLLPRLFSSASQTIANLASCTHPYWGGWEVISGEGEEEDKAIEFGAFREKCEDAMNCLFVGWISLSLATSFCNAHIESMAQALQAGNFALAESFARAFEVIWDVREQLNDPPLFENFFCLTERFAESCLRTFPISAKTIANGMVRASYMAGEDHSINSMMLRTLLKTFSVAPVETSRALIAVTLHMSCDSSSDQYNGGNDDCDSSTIAPNSGNTTPISSDVLVNERLDFLQRIHEFLMTSLAAASTPGSVGDAIVSSSLIQTALRIALSLKSFQHVNVLQLIANSFSPVRTACSAVRDLLANFASIDLVKIGITLQRGLLVLQEALCEGSNQLSFREKRELLAKFASTSVGISGSQFECIAAKVALTGSIDLSASDNSFENAAIVIMSIVDPLLKSATNAVSEHPLLSRGFPNSADLPANYLTTPTCGASVALSILRTSTCCLGDNATDFWGVCLSQVASRAITELNITPSITNSSAKRIFPACTALGSLSEIVTQAGSESHGLGDALASILFEQTLMTFGNFGNRSDVHYIERHRCLCGISEFVIECFGQYLASEIGNGRIISGVLSHGNGITLLLNASVLSLRSSHISALADGKSFDEAEFRGARANVELCSAFFSLLLSLSSDPSTFHIVPAALRNFAEGFVQEFAAIFLLSFASWPRSSVELSVRVIMVLKRVLGNQKLAYLANEVWEKEFNELIAMNASEIAKSNADSEEERSSVLINICRKNHCLSAYLTKRWRHVVVEGILRLRDVQMKQLVSTLIMIQEGFHSVSELMNFEIIFNESASVVL